MSLCVWKYVRGIPMDMARRLGLQRVPYATNRYIVHSSPIAAGFFAERRPWEFIIKETKHQVKVISMGFSSLS